MMDALKQLLEKLGVQFTMGPATLMLIIVLITGCTYLYFDNKGTKKKIPALEQKIKDQNIIIQKQGSTIAELSGSIASFNAIVTTFMDNPPSVLISEISMLKQMIERYHHPNFSPPPAPREVTLPDTIQ